MLDLVGDLPVIWVFLLPDGDFPIEAARCQDVPKPRVGPGDCPNRSFVGLESAELFWFVLGGDVEDGDVAVG